MTNKDCLMFTEKIVQDYHRMHASIFWIIRGMQIDDNLDRMNRDWSDAKQIVGFKLADNILSGCREGRCYSIPPYYLPYLSSISLYEFKKMKAFLIWEKNYNKPLPDRKKDSIYFESCQEVEEHKDNCKYDFKEMIPNDVKQYVIDAKINSYDDIIRIKAYWNSTHENNHDNEDDDWYEAEKMVEAIYTLLEGDGCLDSEKVIELIELIDQKHYMANMFEYILRCHLIKYVEPTGRNI